MLMMPRRYGGDWFDQVFRSPFFANVDGDGSMRTDIQELDEKYLLNIDIPGFEKEDIKAELKDGYLTVMAEKNESNEEKDKAGNYIRRERYYGKCQRSFYVGDGITQEDIKGAFKNGTLSLEIPKKDAKQIEQKNNYIAIE